MPSYKAIVHYHFKNGKERQGLRFLQNNLIRKAKEYGCHGIELLQEGKNPTFFIGIGTWNSLEEARRFQAIWNKKEKQMNHFCIHRPKRQFFKVKSTYMEKTKKAA
jgi:quinol monooxygenase YgiN